MQNDKKQDDASLDEYKPIFVKSAVNISFPERVYYFCSGALITKANREFVELCILVEAGIGLRARM